MQATRINHDNALILRLWRGAITADQLVESIRHTTKAARPDIVYREICLFDASIAMIDAKTLQWVRREIDALRVDAHLTRSHIAFVSPAPHDEPMLRLWVQMRDYEAIGVATRTCQSIDAAADWLDVPGDLVRDHLTEMAESLERSNG